MIEGLKVTVQGTELKSLCEAERNRHLERAETYRAQLKNFKDAEVESANFTGGDPTRALQAKLVDHDNQAKEIEFIANHINTSEEYILDWDDLSKLGIVARNRY